MTEIWLLTANEQDIRPYIGKRKQQEADEPVRTPFPDCKAAMRCSRPSTWMLWHSVNMAALVTAATAKGRTGMMSVQEMSSVCYAALRIRNIMVCCSASWSSGKLVPRLDLRLTSSQFSHSSMAASRAAASSFKISPDKTAFLVCDIVRPMLWLASPQSAMI